MLGAPGSQHDQPVKNSATPLGFDRLVMYGCTK